MKGAKILPLCSLIVHFRVFRLYFTLQNVWRRKLSEVTNKVRRC